MRRAGAVIAAIALVAGLALAFPTEAGRLADALVGEAERAGQAALGALGELGGLEGLLPKGCSLAPSGQGGTGGNAGDEGSLETAPAGEGGSEAGESAAEDAGDAGGDATGAGEDEAAGSAGSEVAGAGGACGDTAPTRALALLREAAGSFSSGSDGLADEGVSVAELLGAYEELRADPAFDYVSGIQYTYLNDAADVDGCTVSAFELRYLLDEGQVAGYAQAMDDALNEVVGQVQASGATGDEGLARAAADALLARCMGASGSTSTLFSAYGCLVEGRAVGKGFADAYKLVLDRLGVASVVVCDTGSPDGEGTSWNMVEVDGSWYHVDLYWDSRTDEGAQPTQLFFLCSDDAMRSGGAVSWSGPAEVPLGYYERLAGEGPEQRQALAQNLWRQMLDKGDSRLDGIEKYRLTYAEVMQAFDALDPAWYGYVASRGAVYLGADGQDPSECVVCSLTAEYRLSPDQIAAYAQTVSDGVARACQDVPEGADDYAKAAAVHDWLVRNVAYDESDQVASHTAFGLFANGVAVCEGYSQAFKLAMDSLGVPCVIVRSEDMAHQWNMVCLGGAWYHVDVTWDDPTPDRGPDAQVSREHFLRGDEAMRALGYSGWTGGHEAPADWQ